MLPTLADKSVDALITDPPYGVMLGEINNGQARAKDQQPYTTFSDTQEYLIQVVIPAISISLKIAKRGIVTPGNRNAFLYPPPADIGVWYNPAGTGRGRWGFILAHVIFYYGKDPRAGKNATATSVWGGNSSVKDINHPCPKPLAFVKWLVNKGSLPGDTVIDPFMGSGTTGVACVNLGRTFIGIEKEPRYFEIAKKRIEEAQKQMRMF